MQLGMLWLSPLVQFIYKVFVTLPVTVPVAITYLFPNFNGVAIEIVNG